MKKLIFVTAFTFGLALYAADVKPAPSATQDTNTPVAQEELSVTPSKTMSADQAKKASDAGLKIMRQIADARGNIHQKKWAAAKKNLDDAETLVGVIRDEEPTFKIKDRIWIAKKHLEYEDTDQVMPDLVPIFNDLDIAADFTPTTNARTHLNKAKENLQNGNKATAKNELQLAGDALTYTEVDLPLGKTESAILTARRLLDQKKGAGADSVLKDAEGSVIVTMDALVATPDDSGKMGTASQTAQRSKIRKH